MPLPTLPAGVRNQEYWTIDDVPLHCRAWGITTVGDRMGVPELRGDDGRYAYMPGELWLPKLPGPQVIPLSMWMQARDPETGLLAAPDDRTQWNNNWAYLRSLMWTPDRQVVLGRRWLRTDINGTPYVQYAEGLGQLQGNMRPTMQGRAHCTFTANFKLADPFFYSAQITTAHIRVGTPNAIDIEQPGDYAAFHQGADVQVQFVGPLTAPRLANTTTGVACGLSGNVASGETVTCYVTTFTAKSVKPGLTSYRTGEVYSSGGRPWMALAKGDNRLVLGGSGAGYAVVKYRAPFL